MRPDLKALEDLDLVDHLGQPVKFGSAWSDSPVVLVFLRQYG